MALTIAKWAPGGSRLSVAEAVVPRRARQSRFTVPGRVGAGAVAAPATGVPELDAVFAERHRQLQLPNADALVPYADLPLEITMRGQAEAGALLYQAF